MDPISAVGLTASLLKTVDAIAKSISSLVDLQSSYKRADLTVSLLIGHLATLKAALRQICEWRTVSLVAVPHHEQLLSDLNVSIEGCMVLLSILDDRIGLCQQYENKGLKIRGKARLLWGEHDTNQYLTHLNNQIIALNLLLTALQWYKTLWLSSTVDSC